MDTNEILNDLSSKFVVKNNKVYGNPNDIIQYLQKYGEVIDKLGHQGFDVTSDHALPIEDDLRRRDFTINAIAKDSDGNIIDPYGGQEDLKNKIIRVVNPEAFADDPLRMLRAVQFASRFGFTIEPQTMKMIQDNAAKVNEIAPERILTELDKIVRKGNPTIGTMLLIETGLFQQIFGRPKKITELFNKVKTMGEYIYLLATGVVADPAEFFKTRLKGDVDNYKDIKALMAAFSTDVSNPVAARSVAHNMYLIYPLSLKSQIIPEQLKVAAQELLSGKYPKTTGELAVNGNDLMQLGLKGKEIGDAQKMLLLKIYSDAIRNDRKELLSLLNQKSNLQEVSGINRTIPDILKYRGHYLFFGSPGALMKVTLRKVEYNTENNTYMIYFQYGDLRSGKVITTNLTYDQLNEFVQKGRIDYANVITGAHETLTTMDKYTAYQNARNNVGFGNVNEEVKKKDSNDKIEHGCLMLFLDVPIWEKITSVIKSEDVYNKPGYGVEQEPHLTILYGFKDEVNSQEVFGLYKENIELKPIEVRISGISVFENPEFDVVKYDVNSKLLTKINKLMKGLPNVSTFPDYHPHITLAYVKKGEGKKYKKTFEKERILKGHELVFTWKGHRGKDGDTLMLNEKGLLKEEYNEVGDGKYLVNDVVVDINFFVKEYDNWNNQSETPAYKDPSAASVLEFFQNNFEDYSHNEKLKHQLLWALTDREILNETR